MEPTWIADEPVLFIGTNGQRVPGRIAVGAPVDHGDGQARCPVLLDLLRDQPFWIAGEGSLHALMLGLRFLGRMLHAQRARGVRVLDRDDGSDVDLHVLFGELYRSSSPADAGAPYQGGAFGCRHAPLTLAADVQRVLAATYAEPHRAYHTAAHVAEVLRWYDDVADDELWRDPSSVYLACVFHDAVYDPLAKDNEAGSAQLARTLAGAGERTVELIMLTARHGRLAPGDVDDEAALFLDCDMAILAAAPAAFDAYDAAVAIEYRAVPPDAYRAGRRAFLSGLLARPRIFLSDRFHACLDAAARANLARAIAR